MKKFLLFLTLFAVVSFAVAAEGAAKRAPREHRGFYYSMGIGTSFVDFSFEDVYGESEYRKSFEKGRLQSWSVPSFEFRFGRSFANLFALYFLCDMSLLQGEGKYVDAHFYRSREEGPWEKSTVDEYVEDKHGSGAEAFGGVGFSFYPIRNPTSIMNGFFFGLSTGFQGLLFEVRSGGDRDLLSLIGTVSKLEVGKDWWVSDTWSLGFSLGYSVLTGWVDEIDEADYGKFSFMVRLTRG